jgi:hypothetical protein
MIAVAATRSPLLHRLVGDTRMPFNRRTRYFAADSDTQSVQSRRTAPRRPTWRLASSATTTTLLAHRRRQRRLAKLAHSLACDESILHHIRRELRDWPPEHHSEIIDFWRAQLSRPGQLLRSSFTLRQVTRGERLPSLDVDDIHEHSYHCDDPRLGAEHVSDAHGMHSDFAFAQESARSALAIIRTREPNSNPLANSSTKL